MGSDTPSTTFVAPARINLLGEHTDYTGGFVLPMAIQYATRATISARPEGGYSFTSSRFTEALTFPDQTVPASRGLWSDYPAGVLVMLQQAGIQPPPFNLALDGNVPLGSGLSSSASVEVASAVAMLAHSGRTLPARDLALLCQRAENDYVHSPCGIMDQFVVTAAQRDHAMMLDTRDLTFELLPLFPHARIVVVNSMVKHSVATGEYGVRRREVEEGQAAIAAAYPTARQLRDATIAQLETTRNAMSPEAFLRCRHIISENVRVSAAREAMRAGDAAAFGKLLLEAHASMRDDFAASCEEVDFLVAEAAKLPGCFGARMTGGGFGGCTVNLVAEDQVEAFQQQLRSAYQSRYHIEAETFVATAVDGALLRNADALAKASAA